MFAALLTHGPKLKAAAPKEAAQPESELPAERECTDCETIKPAAEFGVFTNRYGRKQLRSKCRSCRVERDRTYRKTGFWRK